MQSFDHLNIPGGHVFETPSVDAPSPSKPRKIKVSVFLQN